jgi:dimethylargininase
MMVAITREVSDGLAACELTYQPRVPIDLDRARVEHAQYEQALRDLGCMVRRLPADAGMPDSVFVEDIAVVLDEVAVITRPGARSRRVETPAVAAALADYRRLVHIEPPGTLDGGDVIATPSRVFVGISGRTNADGARQLAAILTPLGLAVVPVPIGGCLHLKSAAVWIPRQSAILLNPRWVDPAHFAGFHLIDVDPSEPEAANVLAIGDRLVCAEAHAGTRRRLETHGLATVTVPAGELAKAEGGVTCCSIVFRAEG